MGYESSPRHVVAVINSTTDADAVGTHAENVFEVSDRRMLRSKRSATQVYTAIPDKAESRRHYLGVAIVAKNCHR